MSDVIGKGTIEVTADATKLKAGIEDAKKSVRSLGDANKDASAKASLSIDRYIKSLQTQQKTQGMSTRESELYKLSLRGATAEQLKAADASLKLSEAYQRGAGIAGGLKMGFIAVAAAATVVAGGLAGMMISSINAADHMNDLSKVTGISVEDLSGLALAAKQSGTDLDGVADSISKLSQNIGKNGDKFRALGITAKEPLEAFKQLADIFSKIDDPQMRAALGAATLGKSWQSAAPLLSEGSKKLGEMIGKGTKLSGVTTQIAEDADKFNDQLQELKASADGFSMKLAGKMLPAFTDIINAMRAAYDESGKLAALWVGMGGLGAFLFTDEFSSPAVKIKNLSAEIADLEKDQKRLQGDKLGLDRFIFGEPGEIESKISNLKSQIAGLQESMLPKPAPVESPAEARRKAKEKAEEEKRVKNFIDDQRNETSKAQLASDIQRIKIGAEATANAYSNGERIMEARRAAALIDDQEYYAAKLGFLNLNSDAQENALQKEIDRLKAEKLVGKDKIDNARKIAEAEAKLVKLRGDAVANIEVLSIQEVAANNKIAQSYADATIAAQAYIDTVKRQNDAEIAGIGRGTKFRGEQAGRNQIEDKFTGQRQSLERDKRNNLITQAEFDTYLGIAQSTYEKEITLYNERTAAINTAQGDWVNGANEAISNYYDNAKNVAGGIEDLFTNAFHGMEDSIVDFVMNGKASFGDLAKSIIADMVRIQARQALAGLAGGGSSGGMFGSLISMGMSLFGGAGPSNPGAGANGFVDWSSSNPLLSGYVPGRAIGGPVSAGGLYRVNENRPELLDVAGKQYLMMGNQSGSVDANTAGGGFSQVTHINIDGTTDMARNQQLIKNAVQMGNAELVDKLERAGRI